MNKYVYYLFAFVGAFLLTFVFTNDSQASSDEIKTFDNAYELSIYLDKKYKNYLILKKVSSNREYYDFVFSDSAFQFEFTNDGRAYRTIEDVSVYIIKNKDFPVTIDFSKLIGETAYGSNYSLGGTADEEDAVVYSNTNIWWDGKLFFEGPLTTEEALAKIPEGMAMTLEVGGVLATGLIVLAILLGVSLIRRFPWLLARFRQ